MAAQKIFIIYKSLSKEMYILLGISVEDASAAVVAVAAPMH